MSTEKTRPPHAATSGPPGAPGPPGPPALPGPLAPAAREALEARLRETTGLLGVARVVGSATDLPEGLRLVCHELARLTGADTASAHLLDARTGELRPIVAHAVPKHAVAALAASTLAPADLSGLQMAFGQGQVIWSDDVPNDPRFAGGPFRGVPHQSAVLIPLLFDGQVSGAFCLVWWERRRSFEPVELAPLAAIGEQAGALLSNARLREALECRAAGLRALSRVNHVVSSSLDEREVLGAIARAAAELTGAPFVSFWVPDETAQRVTLRAVSDERPGADLPLTSVGFGEGSVGWVAAERRILEVADVFADARFVAPAWWKAHDLKSFLGVPVLLDGSLLAVLAMCGRSAFRLGADEREMLDSFIAQAAVALRNMRLYAESSLYARRLETLTELSRALTASVDPEAILPAVVDAALTLFPGGACRLWTVEGERVRLRAGSGDERDGGPAPLELALGQGLVGEAAASGRSIIVEDLAARAADGSDPSIPPGLVEAGMSSAAVLPLLFAGQAVGVVCLFTGSGRALTPGETKIMEAFAEHAAVAMTKARLFQDIQDRRRVSEELYTLTVSMMRSMDVRQRVATFVRGAQEALRFDRISVLLPDSDGTALEIAASTDEEPAARCAVPIAGGGAIERVWHSGETALILSDADLAALPPLALELHEHPLLSVTRFAAVPLRFQELTIGVVLADNTRSRRNVTRRGVAQLELFCQQLQSLVSNAGLWAETQRRERDATLLVEVTRRLSSTLDLEQVLDIITDSALSAVELDAAGFYRWDTARGGLALVRGRNLPETMTRDVTLRSGEGVSGRAFAERSAVWTRDWKSDPSLHYRPETVAALETGGAPTAYVAVPIIIRDDVYGVLLGGTRARHRFTERDVHVLSSMAAQAAVAIENARLYTVTQYNLAAAALLNDAARTLHRTLDARRLLPDALQGLGQTFSAVGAAVILFGEGGSGQGTVIRWGAMPEDAMRALAEPLGKREAPLLVPDAASRPDLIPAGALEAGPRGLAAFPVRGRSRVLGGLALLFSGHRSLYEAETRLLAAYADQLAMALDNTALFEEAENKKTQLEQVFASTSDGFLVVDLGGRIVGFNRQGGELLGIIPDEVVGRPFQHLVEVLGPAVAWVEGNAPALLPSNHSGRPAAAAGDLELRAPEPRTLGWRAAPTRDLLGATVGVTITLNDVTRQREIDRMKTEFVSTVSHELRTPLTSIKGSLHLLLSDPTLQLDATQRQLVDISVKNTDRLIRLITNILDISKIEAGHIQLELGMHRVEEFVSAAVDGIVAFAESRRIAIEVEVPDDLPPVQVDVDRMVQVVTNLLSNAIKFSPPGSTVTVTARRAGKQLELRVTDHGRGIAAEDMGKLFKKFQQLDGSNVRSVGGTGLGLAICRGIVDEHGGSIGVESQPGQGATFTVTVPLPAGEGVDGTDGAEPGPGHGPLILVVDDEHDIRTLLRDQLELEGFRVLEAGRALEAVEVARERQPDLITMDLMLPDLDGFEAIRLLRENARTREIPVVILSAMELGDDDTRALGPTTHLAKPFSRADLLGAIRANLRLDRSVGR
jgi:signal transduction histidine kinase/signal transduction protein with GAF and PtsI domain